MAGQVPIRGLPLGLLVLVVAGLLATLVDAASTGKTNSVSLSPESTKVMSANLPAGRSSASAVWIGDYAYLFGGFDGSLSKAILRYDPKLDTFNIMPSTLPTAVSATSATTDGQAAYIFGGMQGLLSRHIIRYDPVKDNPALSIQALPTARSETAAAWVGSNAYVIGGFDGKLLDEIVRYNPATLEVTVMGAHLPGGRSGPTSVSDGTFIYIFGGSQNGDQILRYDPAADTIAVMGSKLPAAVYRAASTWDGRFAYVFGGSDGRALDQILRYDPQTDHLETLPVKLPYGRSEAAAAAHGYTSYVIGGCCDGANLLRDVVGLVSANAVPVAEFSATRSGLSVAVDASGALDTDGSIIGYAWDWGDGSASGSGREASHTYNSAGTKTIALKVTDNRGLSAQLDLDFALTAPSATSGPNPPFLPIPRVSAPPPAPAATPSGPQPPGGDDSQVGGSDASDRSAGKSASSQSLGSRIAQALSSSWSETPGLWVTLSLMIGTGSAVAAVFLFRLSAHRPVRRGVTVKRGEPRQKPPARP